MVLGGNLKCKMTKLRMDFDTGAEKKVSVKI